VVEEVDPSARPCGVQGRCDKCRPSTLMSRIVYRNEIDVSMGRHNLNCSIIISMLFFDYLLFVLMGTLIDRLLKIV